MARRNLACSATFGLLTLALLPSCSSTPSFPFGGREERVPIVLDNDRPLQILRWEANRYACAPEVLMVCNGATRMFLLCSCPTIRR
jgi:hypothetical protein